MSIAIQGKSAQYEGLFGAAVLIGLWTIFPLAEIVIYLTQSTSRGGSRSEYVPLVVLCILFVGSLYPIDTFYREFERRWGLNPHVTLAFRRLPLAIALIIEFGLSTGQQAINIPGIVFAAATWVQPDSVRRVIAARLWKRTGRLEIGWSERQRIAFTVLSSAAFLTFFATLLLHTLGVMLEGLYWLVAWAYILLWVLQVLGVTAPEEPESAAVQLTDQPEFLSYLRGVNFVAKVCSVVGGIWYLWAGLNVLGLVSDSV